MDKDLFLHMNFDQLKKNSSTLIMMEIIIITASIVRGKIYA